MKKLFTLAVLAATALSASAIDVPWESYGLPESDGWTIIDVDKNGTANQGKWFHDTNNTFVFYNYLADAPANDYITSPAIKLQKGWKYTISYQIATRTEIEHLRVLLCEGNDLTSLQNGKAINDHDYYKNQSYVTMTASFTAAADGEFHISFYCHSPKDCYTLYVRDFKISGEAGSGKEDPAISFDTNDLAYFIGSATSEYPKLNKPDDIAFSDFVWTSSDENIATVDGEGNVTPLRAEVGATTIKAVFAGNDKYDAGSAEYKIAFYKGNGSLSFDTESVEAVVGEAVPEVALTKSNSRIEVIWTSSDETVATVEKGIVTAVGPGTAIITASANTDLWDVAPASYTVTVKEKAPFVVEPIAAGCHEFNTMEDPVAGTPDEVTGWVNYTWTVSGRSSNDTYEVDLQLEGYDYVAYALWPEAGAEVNAPVRRASADIAYDATADNLKEQYSDLQEVKLENGVARISLPVYNYGNEVKEVVPSTYVLFPGKAAAEGETGTYNTSATHTLVSAMNYDSSTGVAGIEAEQGEAEYYNLQGVRVANPERGIYVRVQNGKAVKVML